MRERKTSSFVFKVSYVNAQKSRIKNYRMSDREMRLFVFLRRVAMRRPKFFIEKDDESTDFRSLS